MELPLNIIVYNGFEPEVLIRIFLLLLLILMSGLSSGSETSLFLLSPKDIQRVRSRKSKSDKAILKLLSNEDYMLATILIVNNMVNICLILLADGIIDSLWTITSAAWNFVITTIVVTFILLLFGEIIPKVTASHIPLRFASIVARPLLGAEVLFKPVSWIMVRIGNSMSRRNKKDNISMGELSDALEMTSDQSREEKKMLSGIVEFSKTDVEDIMHPRLDMVAISVESGYDEVRKTIVDSGFSRIPVYRESIDNIEGILYVKDMLRHLDRDDDFMWQKYLRGAYYVPEHKKINDLLKEFQNNKVHMAIVVDEYGSTLGLVSLEDILEEIVGEITDESDKEEDFYTKTGENTYIFDGKTHICDLTDILEIGEDIFDDVRGQAETVAGLLLEIRRGFLGKGETVISHGIKFTVNSMEGRRIDKIKVEKE